MATTWDERLSDEENVKRIVDENLLGLPSRSRAHDVMVRALRPRFVDPGGQVVSALRLLVSHAEPFRDACYYELSRVDGLVACFVEEKLTAWWSEGRVALTTADAREWIDKLVADGRVPDWSPNIRERVARGMLAALRDCGRLSGAHGSPRKEITRPGISEAGFAYVAFRLHEQGVSGRGTMDSDVWARWMLSPQQVDQAMQRLAALGILYFSVAGSSMRIDWRLDSLTEVVRAAL